MQLNTIKPARGSKKPVKRLGRGIGSGLGKTSGKGHKGQHARAGGYHKVGFEGGQMPLQRRLPKFGFSSAKARCTQEIRLEDLNKLEISVIDIEILKEHGLINKNIRFVKLIKTGNINKAFEFKNIHATKSAREAVIHAGGKFE
jgi:large subunit ribosomal protein L15